MALFFWRHSLAQRPARWGYLTDEGIWNEWMKEAAAALQFGTAALFVLVRKVTADKVFEGLKGEGWYGAEDVTGSYHGSSAAGSARWRPGGAVPSSAS